MIEAEVITKIKENGWLYEKDDITDYRQHALINTFATRRIEAGAPTVVLKN